MRLEGATARRREMKYDPKTAKLITIKTIVHVVYKTDEQNISDAQIKSQITALNKDYRAKNADRSKVPDAVEGAGDRRAHRVQAGRGHADEDGRRRRSRHDDGVKKAATGGIAPITPKTHMNMWVCALERRAARLRAVPGRTGGHRRRGDQRARRSARRARRRRPSTRAARPRTKWGTI